MFRELIGFEARVMMSQRQTLLHSVLFYLISITIFRLAFGYIQIEPNISFGIILTLVLLSIIVSSDLVILDDIKDGSVAQLFLSGVGLQKIIMLKFAFYTLTSLVFAQFALIIGGLLLGFFELGYFIIIALVIPAIIQVVIVSSLITVKTNSKMMAMIIALPFLISPIIIGILSAANMQLAILLVAMNLFFIPITLFFGSALLRRQF